MSVDQKWKVLEQGKRPCPKCGKGEVGYENRQWFVGARGTTKTWSKCSDPGCGFQGDAVEEREGPRVDTGGRTGPAR